MKIREEKNGETLICDLEGEINISNSPELRKAFDGLIKRNEKKVLMGFSGVSYIDSSGLATLIEMYQRLKRIDGRLRLYGMSENVRNFFEITKLHNLFETFSDRETALQDF